MEKCCDGARSVLRRPVGAGPHRLGRDPRPRGSPHLPPDLLPRTLHGAARGHRAPRRHLRAWRLGRGHRAVRPVPARDEGAGAADPRDQGAPRPVGGHPHPGHRHRRRGEGRLHPRPGDLRKRHQRRGPGPEGRAERENAGRRGIRPGGPGDERDGLAEPRRHAGPHADQELRRIHLQPFRERLRALPGRGRDPRTVRDRTDRRRGRRPAPRRRKDAARPRPHPEARNLDGRGVRGDQEAPRGRVRHPRER